MISSALADRQGSSQNEEGIVFTGLYTAYEEKGVLIKDAGPRDAPEITLRVALEQHVTKALDPRQRNVSAEKATGYADMLRLHVPRWLDMPITDITRQMINEKIKAMANKPTTASFLLRTLSAVYGRRR